MAYSVHSPFRDFLLYRQTTDSVSKSYRLDHGAVTIRRLQCVEFSWRRSHWLTSHAAVHFFRAAVILFNVFLSTHWWFVWCSFIRIFIFKKSYVWER